MKSFTKPKDIQTDETDDWQIVTKGKKKPTTPNISSITTRSPSNFSEKSFNQTHFQLKNKLSKIPGLNTIHYDGKSFNKIYITDHKIVSCDNKIVTINIENNFFAEYQGKDIKNKYKNLIQYINDNFYDFHFILLQECDIEFEKLLNEISINRCFKIVSYNRDHDFRNRFYNITLYRYDIYIEHNICYLANYVDDYKNNISFLHNVFQNKYDKTTTMVLNVKYSHKSRSTFIKNDLEIINKIKSTKMIEDKLGTEEDPIFELLYKFIKKQDKIDKIYIGGDFNKTTFQEILQYRIQYNNYNFLNQNIELDICNIKDDKSKKRINIQITNENKYHYSEIMNNIKMYPLFSLDRYNNILDEKYNHYFSINLITDCTDVNPYWSLRKSDDRIYLFVKK